MNVLENYLKNATYYLDGLSDAQLSAERTRAIDYCNSHNLSENFLQEVEKLPGWLDLAKSTGVKFYIEEPLRERPGFPRNAFIKTGVFARIFDSGKSAVIKIVI